MVIVSFLLISFFYLTTRIWSNVTKTFTAESRIVYANKLNRKLLHDTTTFLRPKSQSKKYKGGSTYLLGRLTTAVATSSL